MTTLASYIDHTVLKPDTTNEDIERLCEEALTYGFKAVCVPPYYVKMASDILYKGDEESVKVATVIGFPLGYSQIAAKVEEAKRAIEDGAYELDVVVNLAAIKNQRWNYVENELDILTTTCHLHDRKIKIIFEASMLTEVEIQRLCLIATNIGADFVKTSTGFNGGATIAMIRLMKNNLPNSILIKASGGIRSVAEAKAMIEAGASRIGTSASVAMMNEGQGS
jgi:deoxyribose-phosphate aldolase